MTINFKKLETKLQHITFRIDSVIESVESKSEKVTVKIVEFFNDGEPGRHVRLLNSRRLHLIQTVDSAEREAMRLLKEDQEAKITKLYLKWTSSIDLKSILNRVDLGAIRVINELTTFKKLVYFNLYRSTRTPTTFPISREATKRFYILIAYSTKPRYLYVDSLNGKLRLCDRNLAVIKSLEISQACGPIDIKSKVFEKRIFCSFVSYNYKYTMFYSLDFDLNVIHVKKLNWVAESYVLERGLVCFTSCYMNTPSKTKLCVMTADEMKLIGEVSYAFKDTESVLYCDFPTDRVVVKLKSTNFIQIYRLRDKKSFAKIQLSTETGGCVISCFVDTNGNVYAVRTNDRDGTKLVECYNLNGVCLLSGSAIKPFQSYKSFDFYNGQFYFYNELHQMRRVL